MMIKPPRCHVKNYRDKGPSWISQLTSRRVTKITKYVIIQTIPRTLATNFPRLPLRGFANLSSLSQLFGAEFDEGLFELKSFLAWSRHTEIVIQSTSCTKLGRILLAEVLIGRFSFWRVRLRSVTMGLTAKEKKEGSNDKINCIYYI
jgi:hypothetical protein